MVISSWNVLPQAAASQNIFFFIIWSFRVEMQPPKMRSTMRPFAVSHCAKNVHFNLYGQIFKKNSNHEITTNTTSPHFMVSFGCSVLFPGGLCMVRVISYRLLGVFSHLMEACRCSLLFHGGFGCLVLFLRGFWMVPIISDMLLEGCSRLPWMLVVFSWWLLGAWCYFLEASGWFLLVPAGSWRVVVISWKEQQTPTSTTKGVDPAVNHRRGSTPIYEGRDDSLKGVDP